MGSSRPPFPPEMYGTGHHDGMGMGMGMGMNGTQRGGGSSPLSTAASPQWHPGMGQGTFRDDDDDDL
jgi:hypothetical protein